MKRPAHRLNLLRQAASSPRQRKLNFVPKLPESQEIPAAQSGPHFSDSDQENEAAQCGPHVTHSDIEEPPVEPMGARGEGSGTKSAAASADTGCGTNAAAGSADSGCGTNAAAGSADSGRRTNAAAGSADSADFWAAACPCDLRNFRRIESIAARGAQDYHVTVLALENALKLPCLHWRAEDQLEEALSIAKRNRDDMDAALAGHRCEMTQAFLCEATGLQRIQAQCLKFRALCKDAAKESKAKVRATKGVDEMNKD